MQDYKDSLAYFMHDFPQTTDTEKPVNAEIIKRLAELHSVFKTYYDNIKDARKESYFISQRLELLDKLGAQLTKDIRLPAVRLTRLLGGDRQNPNTDTGENATPDSGGSQL